jgi:hypothetical protein
MEEVHFNYTDSEHGMQSSPGAVLVTMMTNMMNLFFAKT